MNKLKIAFFSDMLMRDYDGCMRTVFHIIDRQPEDVDIKYFTGQGSVKGLNQPAVTVPNMTIPFNNDYKIALPQLAYFKIRREIELYKPDVIHITTPSMLGNFALQIAKEKGIPVSTIYHTHYISYINYYLENLKAVVPIAEMLMKSSTKSFYNKCDLILVSTQEMIGTLEEVGVDKTKMKIWKRGIDRKVFNSKLRDERYVKQITGNDNFNILFASRLVWEKNLRTLVRIYKQAEEQNLKVNFIIAGDGSAYESLTHDMPNAYFLGSIEQSELGKLYASCDTFVFPSVSETYGNVVLEAMTSGLPCVIANGGGSKSFIDHNHYGFLCQPFEELEYIRHIKNLMTDQSLRFKVINNGINYSQGFDWDTLTEDFYNSLHSLSLSQENLALAKRI